MSIHQTKDGRWFTVYYEGTKQKRKYFGRGAEAKKAAKAFDHKVKYYKKDGKHLKLKKISSPFQVIAQQYLDFKAGKISDKSIYDINLVLNRHILPQIGHIPCENLTQNDLTDLIQAITTSNGNITNKTINRYCQYVRAILNWAVKHGIIETNPIKLTKLKEKKYVPVLPTLKEFTKILEHAPDHLRWALEVEYYTGCRPGPSELFALRWDDIDWDLGIIRIYNPKTDKTLIKTIKKPFLKKLKKRYAARHSEYIVEYKGRPIKSLKRSWATAKEAAGIKKRIRLYDLRHMYATLMLLAGGDIKAVSNLMGHHSVEFTLDTYYQIVESMKNHQTDLLPDLKYKKNIDQNIDQKKRPLKD